MARIGKFEVHIELMAGEHMPKILALMQFVPLRVERMHWRDVFECVGLSPLFDEVPEGEIFGTYRIEVRNEFSEVGADGAKKELEVIATRVDDCRWPMCQSKEVQEQAARAAEEAFFDEVRPFLGQESNALDQTQDKQ